MPTREELDQQAEALGLDPADYTTKEDLQAAIDDAEDDTDALGTRVDSEGNPIVTSEPDANPVEGVQPMTDEDIPESGR